MNYAQTLLARGQFQQGWAEYEWRLKSKPFAGQPAAPPQWAGEDLAGKTILLRSEQGLGDSIQFVRFAPWVAKRGAAVLLRCQPELRRILTGMPGIDRLLPPDEPLPPCDCQCPLPSLPGALGIELPSIPGRVPYLLPDPAADKRLETKARPPWRTIPGRGWYGPAPRHKNDRNRSMQLSHMSALARTANVLFVSLQKGAPAAQLATPPAGMAAVDVGPDANDFADTAAVIASLDLVISVDPAVAHLAGAMAKPVSDALTDRGGLALATRSRR